MIIVGSCMDEYRGGTSGDMFVTVHFLRTK